jgi:SNF2 family DNA or RNA helicase
MLDLAKSALEELAGHGIKVAKLHGTRGEPISHTDRRRALQDFEQPVDSGGAHVLLLVLGQHSAGLTLNQARTAILMEPQLQSGAETQAAGRIARIGQRHETRFIRLITQHTVEPHILRRAKEDRSVHAPT